MWYVSSIVCETWRRNLNFYSMSRMTTNISQRKHSNATYYIWSFLAVFFTFNWKNCWILSYDWMCMRIHDLVTGPQKQLPICVLFLSVSLIAATIRCIFFQTNGVLFWRRVSVVHNTILFHLQYYFRAIHSINWIVQNNSKYLPSNRSRWLTAIF